MAIALSAKQNVEAPSVTYPYGSIKDNTGLNDGTPVNRAVYSDFHQFFARLLEQAVITPNGLPDNATNTYQYFLALIQNIRNTAATESLAGTGEIATQAETNLGLDDTRFITPLKLATRAATESLSGLAEIATTAETNTGTDDARMVTPLKLAGRTATESRTGIAELATQAETDTGTDDARMVTPLKLKTNLTNPTFTAVTFLNSWANFNGASYSNGRYMKDRLGWICLTGIIQGGTTGSVAFNLPAGFRPTKIQSFGGSDYDNVSIVIGSNGDVVINYSGSGNYVSLDGIRFPII